MVYLVIDFEFTMKQSYGSPRAWFPEIIEVGAVVSDSDGNISGKKYTSFVKPKFWPRLTEECYGVTGIRQEDVNSGIPLEKALDALKQMVNQKDTWLVAWGDADKRVLRNTCEKYGIDFPFDLDNYIDLAESYRVFANIEKRASLKNAVEYTGVEKTGILHSAQDDAYNAALVLKHILASGWNLNNLKECQPKLSA